MGRHQYLLREDEPNNIPNTPLTNSLPTCLATGDVITSSKVLFTGFADLVVCEFEVDEVTF